MIRHPRSRLVASVLALCLSATGALAAITSSLDPSQAPSGTHLQTGAIGCTVDPTTLAVTCSTFELAGVGHTDADVALTASYTAIVDCNNPGANRNNPIESHTTSFSASTQITVTSGKNGRLSIPQQSVSPTSVAQGCPNPNWTPVIRAGTLTLESFSYTVTFEDFASPYITVTGP
jgi:hypothetical protein